VPGFQFVLENYALMKTTGNRDHCYFNEKCFIPSYWTTMDVPMNALLSNLPYMINGFIAICYTFWLEVTCRSKAHKYFNYSLAYAIGSALFLEGLFSLIYHICPTRSIFQMDTACMFLISSLMVASLHHGWSVTKNDQLLLKITKTLETNDYVYRYLNSPDEVTKRPRKPIPAAKLFLYFMCPLLIFNYVGSILDMDIVSKEHSAYKGSDNMLKWIFGPLQVLWILSLVFWALGNNGFKEKWIDKKPSAKCYDKEAVNNDEILKLQRITNGTRIVCGLVVVIICGAMVSSHFIETLDFSQLFLFGCIILSVVTLIITELRYRIQLKAKFKKQRDAKQSNLYTINSERSGGEGSFKMFTRVYYLILAIVWVIAFYFFAVVGSTNKSAQPHISRVKNTDCQISIWGPHDLWHFFSAIGLLMTLLRAITLGFPCRRCRFEDLYFDPDKVLEDQSKESETVRFDAEIELISIGPEEEEIPSDRSQRSRPNTSVQQIETREAAPTLRVQQIAAREAAPKLRVQQIETILLPQSPRKRQLDDPVGIRTLKISTSPDRWHCPSIRRF